LQQWRGGPFSPLLPCSTLLLISYSNTSGSPPCQYSVCMAFYYLPALAPYSTATPSMYQRGGYSPRGTGMARFLPQLTGGVHLTASASWTPSFIASRQPRPIIAVAILPMFLESSIPLCSLPSNRSPNEWSYPDTPLRLPLLNTAACCHRRLTHLSKYGGNIGFGIPLRSHSSCM